MTNNTKQLIIMAVAIALMAPVATCAFADNNTNNGNANIINTSNYNGSGSGSTTSNSYNPHITATGGNAAAFGGSARSESRSSSASIAAQKQGQGQSQSADNAGNAQSVTQSYAAQKRNPVSTAFAAPLVAADDTCMGSTSISGQGAPIGISFGKTYQDADCVRRKDARELHNMGHPGAAIALMCQNENVAAAMQTAGTPCPGKASDLNPAAGATESAHTSSANSDVVYEYPNTNRTLKW